MESITDQQNSLFQSIEKKRHLLASLIRVARDISGHTHSLNDALLLARPSQNYPPKALEYKKQVDHYLLLLKEPDLKNRSGKYDHQSSILLDALLEFINIAEQQVDDASAPKEFDDDMRAQLKEFGLVTKVAVVLRILLQDLGIVLAPVKYSIPQEWLGEQISLLNEANHQLRIKATDKVAELILDVSALMRDDTISKALQDTLEYVHDAMTENLEYLEHGGNIEQLPYEFEELEITSLPEHRVTQYLKDKHVKEEQAHQEEDNHKMKFNEKLKLWLNTPWNKRWRDLE